MKSGFALVRAKCTSLFPSRKSLASIFGPAMSGDMSSRNRMIRAFAKLPEQYYPILEEAILEYTRKLSQEKGE